MSDKTRGLTDQQLDEIEQRAARLYERTASIDPNAHPDFGQLTDADVPALVAEVHRLRARVAELEGPAVEARTALADAVVEWSGQTVGCHVPTVDAIVELINPQSEPRVCGDRLVDWACSLRDGRHLDGKHRDEFKGAWWDQSSVPPYSNRDRVAAEESGVQG
jgi:hypothetical protein